MNLNSFDHGERSDLLKNAPWLDALGRGRVVEYRSNNWVSNSWQVLDGTVQISVFADHSITFRFKPEPITLYVRKPNVQFLTRPQMDWPQSALFEIRKPDDLENWVVFKQEI